MAENAEDQTWQNCIGQREQYRFQEFLLGRKCRKSDLEENAEDSHCRKRRGQSLQKTQTDIAIVQRRGSDIAENAGSYGHQKNAGKKERKIY